MGTIIADFLLMARYSALHGAFLPAGDDSRRYGEMIACFLAKIKVCLHSKTKACLECKTGGSKKTREAGLETVKKPVF